MATQRCWDCGQQFNVLDDEVGEHSCPNPYCRSNSEEDSNELKIVNDYRKQHNLRKENV